MPYQLTTKKEIRQALEGDTEDAIRSVQFPDWIGPVNGEGEPRSLTLFLASGKAVTITATSYQALRIEEL